ncbi:MAG: hypothetical protein ABIB71_07725 [Candidatus Woesearchaeota archaeon]
MKRKLSIVVLMLILLAASVSANVIITHKGPTYLEAGGVAEFTVTIENDDSKIQKLNIQSDPYASLESSRFEYVIVSPTRIDLQGHEKKDLKVLLKLKEDVPYEENYATFIKLNSLTDTSVKEDYYFVVRVVPPSDILSISSSMPEKVNPSGELNFDIILNNKLNTKLPNVKIYVSSGIFSDERSIEFFPKQERTENFKFSIPALTEAGDYQLNFRVYSGDKLVRKGSFTFTVTENVDVKEKEESSSGFLYSEITITKSNYGNTPVQESFSISLSSMQRMFAKYNVAPTLFEEDKVSWVVTINPERQYTVQVSIDYRPLFFAVLGILAFAGVVVYLFTRKVMIRKEILTVKKTADGMSELKVLLHVKNKTRGTIRHLSLVEFLPSIIHPSAKFATLKPSKMQKGEKGIRMIWEIPELVKGEERIISYEVKSKLGIVGKLMLPHALLKYKTAGGRVAHIKSNNAGFHSYAQELEENQ